MAHRWYYEKYKGSIPEGLVLDHLCRNRACVNPEHLEPVTLAENVQRGNNAKLTRKEVENIREMFSTGDYTRKELCNIFNIGGPNVGEIINNQIWK